jgi:heat shock protein 5
MASQRASHWGLGLFLIGLFAVLFSPTFVQQVRADEIQEYGTVIGIVGFFSRCEV